MHIIDALSHVFQKNVYFSEYLLQNDSIYDLYDFKPEYNFEPDKPTISVYSQASLPDFIQRQGLYILDIENKVDEDDKEYFDYIYSEHVAMYVPTQSFFLFQTDKIKEGELDQFLVILPDKVKQEILNNPPKRFNEFIKDTLQRQTKALTHFLIEYKRHTIEHKIESLYKEIDDHAYRINEIYKQINNISKSLIAKTDIKQYEDFAKVIFTNPNVDYVSFVDDYISIKTKSLPIKYVVNEHLLDNENLDFSEERKQALLNNNLYICPYIIIFYLQKDNLSYSILHDTSYENKNYNYHYTRYQCLGNFAPRIEQARSEYNLFALFHLILQYLQTVTLPDPAAIETINNAQIGES